MRKVTLYRYPSTDQGTFGEMREHIEFVCFTCERPWINNAHRISCIPKGKYTARKEETEHHGLVFRLLNVPDRDAILIHAGNIMFDSEGCILVGEALSDNVKIEMPGVTNSRATLKKFMERFKDDPEIEIEIV